MATLDEKEQLITGATDLFFDDLKEIDEDFAKEIIKIYAQFVVGGTLVLDPLQLAKLEESLIAAIGKTKYKLKLNAYLPNFAAVDAMNKIIHKEVNKIDINALINENARIANFQESVKSRLKATPSTMVKVVNVVDGKRIVETVAVRNSSLNELIDPIANIIRKDVIMGVDFKGATERVLEAITTKKLGLTQWAGQIAIDALSQADGIVQAEVAKEFPELDAIQYVGTIKNTTRPICYHIIKEGAVLSYEELGKVLKEFVPNGVPSKSTTTKTANGKQQNKGDGIIPGTDLDNFLVYRGGYRCRHNAIPTRKNSKK